MSASFLTYIYALWVQTFAYADSRKTSDEDGESAAVQLLRRAEDQYATAIEREMNTLLLTSLQKKAQVRDNLQPCHIS